LALQQAIDHDLGGLHRRQGGDGLGIEGVQIFARGQHVGVPDRVAARAREDVFPFQAFQQTAQFVVGADLLQTEFQEFHQGLDASLSTLV
jgi:hypothetical protein